eukprot:1562496-Prorocentrum_lima.AAC.1
MVVGWAAKKFHKRLMGGQLEPCEMKGHFGTDLAESLQRSEYEQEEGENHFDLKTLDGASCFPHAH